MLVVAGCGGVVEVMCVCEVASLQPGPSAAVAGYLKKQELFSTTSHQSPVSDD